MVPLQFCESSPPPHVRARWGAQGCAGCAGCAGCTPRSLDEAARYCTIINVVTLLMVLLQLCTRFYDPITVCVGAGASCSGLLAGILVQYRCKPVPVITIVAILLAGASAAAYAFVMAWQIRFMTHAIGGYGWWFFQIFYVSALFFVIIDHILLMYFASQGGSDRGEERPLYPDEEAERYHYQSGHTFSGVRGATVVQQPGVQQAKVVKVVQVPQPQVLAVTVPNGAVPGQQLTIQAPDGQQLSVNVPDGVAPGQSFEVQYKA